MEDGKEALIQSGKLGMAAGEEELLALYLSRVDGSDQHDFVLASEFDKISVDEGMWEHFQVHPDRLAQIEENRVSYAWDSLIEHFTKHILGGTSAYQTDPSIAKAAKPLQFMARSSRTQRRSLAKALLGNLQRGATHDKAARVVLPDSPPDLAFVFLTLKPRPSIPYDAYQNARRNFLEAYCRVVRHRFPQIRDIVGVASEPAGAVGSSEDLAYFDARNWTTELDADAQQLSEDLDILTDPKMHHLHESEYPRSDIRERMKGRNRNAPCSCGSGRKFKKCCGATHQGEAV